MVRRKETKAFFEGQFVFPNVLFTKNAPIPGSVAAEGLNHVLGGQGLLRVGRDNGLARLDPTVTQKIYFEMKMYAGYQHVCTVVYDEDGEYVATVYPAQGLRELPIMTVTSVVTMVNLIPSGIWR